MDDSGAILNWCCLVLLQYGKQFVHIGFYFLFFCFIPYKHQKLIPAESADDSFFIENRFQTIGNLL